MVVFAQALLSRKCIHLSKQEEGDGKENAEVENGGDEKDGDGVVDVQMVETGGEGGVDRSGDAREENEGVLESTGSLMMIRATIKVAAGTIRKRRRIMSNVR